MEQPRISRTTLSRSICEWLDWRGTNGDFQLGSCRKALAKLNRKGVVTLPPIDETYSFQSPSPKAIDFPIPEICCSLSELGKVEVVPINTLRSKEGRICSQMLERFHYLGKGKLCGAQIHYVIKSDLFGYLGALSFSSASFSMLQREQFIGWSEAARLANLHLIVANSRFLILPSVHVNNLASHVLSLTLARLPNDWEFRYKVRPVLVETFVDPTQFVGTCYKASNWTYIGQTSGRRDGVQKDLYLYFLSPQWREKLCQEPEVCLGGVPAPESPKNWMENEFGTIRLYDQRLKERLYSVAEAFYNRPLANIPEVCGSRAGAIGAYRLFQNKKINMDVILTPHTEASVGRIKKHKVVLAPQDTSTLNYTHPATQGLGPINTIENNAKGLILHDTVAFTQDGTPLGVLDAQCWARDPEDKGKSKRRKDLPIEQKESVKWLRSFRKVAEVQKLCPDTTLVSIGDRESDIYELFLEATKDPLAPRLVVRAEKSRNRKVADQYLWDFMEQQPISGSLKIHLPKRGNTKARDAHINVRYSEVELKPPKDSGYPPVSVWAVHIVEYAADEGISPIEWMLLTTAEVKTFHDAKKRVEWYSGRWGIEVYHRTLKSGCRIKDRQLGNAERLEACLGIDMVIAWRIYHLTMLGRKVPDHPCTVFFEDVEWKALCVYYSQNPTPPPKPPPLQLAIKILGVIGGHLGRKGDGMPGTECIWRGLQRLDTAVDMYVIYTKEKHPRIRKEYLREYLNFARGP